MRFHLHILTIALLVASSISAQDSNQNQAEPDWGIIPVVVPIYTPETGWQITGGGIWWYDAGVPGPYQRLSEVMTFFSASEQGQYGLGLFTELYFAQNKIKISHETEAAYEPYLFWGVGSETPEANREEILPRSLHTRTSLMYLFFPNLYIGPALNSSSQEVLDYAAAGTLDNCGLGNCQQTKSIGPGIQVIYDLRDNPFYPTSGFWLEAGFWYAIQDKTAGGSSTFSQFEIDARSYHPLFKQLLLAVNIYAVFSTNQPGLAALPRLGGQFKMRGYYEGRFIDRNLVMGQAELRFPIWWRFGGVLFAGIGNVGNTFPDLTNPKAAAGFGLRVLLDEKDKLNMRIDFGTNRDSELNGYFTFKEAF